MSVAGWVPAMVVIFLGATAPSAVWPLVGVVALGTVTGVVAGATLGVVTGALLPLLDATSMGDRVALSVLRSPLHGLVDRSLVGLRVRGRHTGRLFELPVMYCRQGDSLLVFVGRSIDKRWWKNVGAATPLMVLLDGRWTWATASRLSQNDPGRDEAARSYFARWPMARRVATDADPIVRIALAGV